MQGYNVIVAFNYDKSQLLMCKRKKNPYKGLRNFVGGKIESNENGEDAAHCKLLGKTGIPLKDIKLTYLTSCAS